MPEANSPRQIFRFEPGCRFGLLSGGKEEIAPADRTCRRPLSITFVLVPNKLLGEPFFDSREQPNDHPELRVHRFSSVNEQCVFEIPMGKTDRPPKR